MLLFMQSNFIFCVVFNIITDVCSFYNEYTPDTHNHTQSLKKSFQLLTVAHFLFVSVILYWLIHSWLFSRSHSNQQLPLACKVNNIFTFSRGWYVSIAWVSTYCCSGGWVKNGKFKFYFSLCCVRSSHNLVYMVFFCRLYFKHLPYICNIPKMWSLYCRQYVVKTEQQPKNYK